jgi:uncharacterized protein YegP (UPF0339 family)
LLAHLFEEATMSHLRRVCVIALLFASVIAFGLSTGRTAMAAEKKAAGASFEVYQDKAGEYRWRMRATNTQIIATSGDGYKEKRSCLEAIESVKRNAADAPVHEMPKADAK